MKIGETNMKKSTFVFLSVLSFIILTAATLSLFSSCSDRSGEKADDEYVIRAAYICNAGSNGLFAEIGGFNSIYSFSMDGVEITENGNGSASLSEGDTVNIVYDGRIGELYPCIPQGVSRIDILTDEESSHAPAFIKALSDIYGKDNGINDNIELVGLEFKAADGCDILSETEKAAISYMLTDITGCPNVTITTFDELQKSGWITKDNGMLCMEKGIYMCVDITKANDSKITFSVQKWRSGLGAVCMEDCSITLSDPNRSEYAPGIMSKA